MRPEELHDALNLLEDDLIMPVEQLRSRKRILHWPRWVAVAACLCLAAVGIVGAYRLGLLNAGSSTDLAAPENISLPVVVQNAQEERTEEAEDQGEGLHDGVDGIHVSLPWAQVRIDRWEGDRFAATVIDGGSGGFLEGDSITVFLTEDTVLTQEGSTEGLDLSSDSQPLKEGTEVQIEFVPGPEAGVVYACILSPVE